jgi:hypothetical protein
MTSHTDTTPPRPNDPKPKSAKDMTPAELKKARDDIHRGKFPPYVPGL